MLRFSVLCPWALLAAQAAHADAYKLFVDPTEHAFTLEVPTAWRVYGAMVRYGPISLAPVVQALAPDGGALVLLGDPALKDYEAPMPGFAAGQTITAGTSIFIIRAPQDGPHYAQSYAAELAARVHCTALHGTSVAQIPNPPGIDSGMG
ncbi:MAG: hypothetical protein JOZ67_06460, partial [Gammaproteobacteria bacterium]|nr:hypothetical protein [Gammaproteobacteria bacterium]